MNKNDTFLITTDEDLCRTILENLIKNAIEASSPESVVTVFLNETPGKQLVVHNESMVSESIRDRFFEKYATHGKKKGIGLGTYSVRLAVEKLGGTILMATSAKLGTRIRVQFAD